MKSGTRVKPGAAPGPADLAACRRDAEWALVAATALEMGVVDALAQEPGAADDLAGRLGLSERGVEILLGALEALRVVRIEDGKARLTGPGRGRLVDRDTPDFEGDALRFWLRNLRRWAGDLPESVRTGEPSGTAVDGSEEALTSFMAAMANKRPELVEAVVRGCLDRFPDASTMLDLGGGPGTFARAFARRGLRTVLYDTPEVVAHVGSAYGLDDEPSIELRAGDFLEKIPDGSFDIVLLGNITHIYDPLTNAGLLERAARAVAPGGVLGILDFIRGETPFAALFAVTMLVNSRHGGRTYDRAAYESWLRSAGLEDVQLRRLDERRHLVTAIRPGGESRMRRGHGS